MNSEVLNLKYVIVLGDVPIDVPHQNIVGCVPGGVDARWFEHR